MIAGLVVAFLVFSGVFVATFAVAAVALLRSGRFRGSGQERDVPEATAADGSTESYTASDQ